MFLEESLQRISLKINCLNMEMFKIKSIYIEDLYARIGHGSNGKYLDIYLDLFPRNQIAGILIQNESSQIFSKITSSLLPAAEKIIKVIDKKIDFCLGKCCEASFFRGFELSWEAPLYVCPWCEKSIAIDEIPLYNSINRFSSIKER